MTVNLKIMISRQCRWGGKCVKQLRCLDVKGFPTRKIITNFVWDTANEGSFAFDFTVYSPRPLGRYYHSNLMTKETGLRTLCNLFKIKLQSLGTGKIDPSAQCLSHTRGLVLRPQYPWGKTPGVVTQILALGRIAGQEHLLGWLTISLERRALDPNERRGLSHQRRSMASGLTSASMCV